jgi:hypothetical protein
MTKEERKEYNKQYYQRPDVKAKHNEKMKEYYQRPEVKASRKEWAKEYYQRPHVKAKIDEKMKEYSQRPEVRKTHNARSRLYQLGFAGFIPFYLELEKANLTLYRSLKGDHHGEANSNRC